MQFKQAKKMALIKLSKYRQEQFEHPRPAINTLKKWIDNGDLKGKKIGTMYFVYSDQNEHIQPVNDLVLKALN